MSHFNYSVTTHTSFSTLKYDPTYKNEWNVSFNQIGKSNVVLIYEFIMTIHDQDVGWAVVTHSDPCFIEPFDCRSIPSVKDFLATFAIKTDYQRIGFGTKFIRHILSYFREIHPDPILTFALTSKNGFFFYKNGADYLDSYVYENGQWMVFGEIDNIVKDFGFNDVPFEINDQPHELCEFRECIQMKSDVCFCRQFWSTRKTKH